MQMNEKIVQSNTRILQTAIQKATERYLLDYSFISLYYSVFPFALFSFTLQTNTIKIVTLFQAYTVTMFKPDYSGYYF